LTALSYPLPAIRYLLFPSQSKITSPEDRAGRRNQEGRVEEPIDGSQHLIRHLYRDTARGLALHIERFKVGAEIIEPGHDRLHRLALALLRHAFEVAGQMADDVEPKCQDRAESRRAERGEEQGQRGHQQQLDEDQLDRLQQRPVDWRSIEPES